MKVYVQGVKDVELESPISEKELSMMINAAQRGISHSQILVNQGHKKGMLDTRDIDVERTLPGFVFDRAA